MILTATTQQGYAFRQVLNTPSVSGYRTRESCGFFTPIVSLWPGSAQKYNTRKGNTAGRLTAVFKYLAAPLNKGRILNKTVRRPIMAAQSQGATAPTVFQFQESTQLRVITIDGEPWFVAADVCAALSIGNTTDALKRLDDDEQALVSIEGISRGNDQVNAVNESGLYSLILGSRKPEAKKFKKWVTSEVLPAIRKTGRYVHPTASVPPQADERFTGNDTANVSRVVWCISHWFRYEGAWVQGVWRELRKATNTPSPQRFRVADLPLIVAELRRLWAVSQAASAFLREAENQFLKRAIRKGENIETLIAEQRALLEAELQDDVATCNGVLKRWDEQELQQITSRTPANRYDYGVAEQ